MRIPLSIPDIHESDIQAVTRVLRTPWLSLGPRLEEFEHSVANYIGAAHAVAVSSGTSALHLCIRALGIGEGDEVIVPSFAFIAVANVVCYERATPVFVDIEPYTLNLDPDKIEAAITPKTRGIIIVHTFGCPAEMKEVLEIARRHRLFVIEDGCEAIGAEYEGRKIGPLGHVGVFAFYPNKQITTGEGGVVVTHDPAIARLCRALRNQGRLDSGDWLEHFELGYNYRISEINCALGNAQLSRIESILSQRETVARAYTERLSGHPALVLPPVVLPSRRISWFVYVVRLSSELNLQHREQIRNGLAVHGIGSSRYFAPIHLQPIYQREICRIQDLQVTEAISERCLALPFFNTLSERQIDEVCEVLGRLLRNCTTEESLSAAQIHSSNQPS